MYFSIECLLQQLKKIFQVSNYNADFWDIRESEGKKVEWETDIEREREREKKERAKEGTLFARKLKGSFYV